MNKSMMLAVALAAVSVANPGLAREVEGRWQVKLLGTGVLPDGKIDTIKTDRVGLPAGSQTRATDSVVPTVAVEYYATPNVSVETICCFTKREVRGTGALAGARIVDDVLIVPATVTVKYHLNAGPIRPYVGVGPSMFLIFGEKPGSTARTLGATKVRMSNEIGLALQGGVDIPLSDGKFGASLDAKKYFIGTTARFYTAAGAKALETEHDLDPWLVSGGVYMRF